MTPFQILDDKVALHNTKKDYLGLDLSVCEKIANLFVIKSGKDVIHMGNFVSTLQLLKLL